jgi:error-prone DNA polymerase
VYAELHCHSTFSLLDGASDPERLVERAVELELPALALTDHDDLGGAVRFATAAKSAGVAGIVGVELTLDATEDGGRKTEAGAIASPVFRLPSPISHLVLLAENRDGYANLSSLVTRARLDNPRGAPRVSLDTLARHADGLYALTGCARGTVPQALARRGRDAACEALATLLDIFGRRVSVEVWDHALPDERELARELIAVARALDVPWVVTNDVHYARPTQRLAHDVLCALRHGETLASMGTRLRPNGEWYLKSHAQMRRRWQEDESGIQQTLAIAERCAFRLQDLKPRLPHFTLPPGVTEDEYLTRLVELGAEERWGWRCTARHDQQLEHELALIAKLGLAGYFLIVWDIVRFARREGILCQGRGSAANSAVCYCLGITAVDPIKLELLFERFLSEERSEAPDIDIDFAHRDRERVLQYVYDKYGREHAAMVCEHITWRGRSAVRDAARVLGYSPQQADELALVADRFSARRTAEALRQSAEGPVRDALGPLRGPAAASRTGPSASASAASAPADPFAPEIADVMGPANYHKRGAVPSFADRLGMQFMPGTQAYQRMREERETHRLVTVDGAGVPPTTVDGGRWTVDKAVKTAAGAAASAVASAVADGDVPAREAAAGPRSGPRASRDGISPSDTVSSATVSPATVTAAAGMRHTLADIVEQLAEAPRHRGIHVGGFVLTEQPLRTVVPIEPAAMEGRTVIQWEKDDLDPVGLVKIDLLGLGMLTLLQDCIKYVRATRGVTIDLAQLDLRDQAVYDDLCNADTVGVFQVESRAQMNTLPRLKPRSFYDLVVEVALIRPGPIQGEMVHPYLRRRAGEEEVTYPHPSLEPALKRTLGVPLFQEQGMQVAIVAAGFTPGEADILRKAMGHKRSHERMASICEKMIAGMKANGISDDVALRIYNQINAFADYGFPESHAASFALIVYASAYLRHYFPAEYLCAILNAQPMGFYSEGTLVEDARRHGVKVLGPDVTRSGWDHQMVCANGVIVRPRDGVVFTTDGVGVSDGRRETEDGRSAAASRSATPLPSPVSRLPSAPIVRLGLRSIRGLGPDARDRIGHARAGGAFRSIDDFVQRTRLDRRALRLLAEAGALDAFVREEPPARRRRVALWKVLEAQRGTGGPLALFPEAGVPKTLPAYTAPELTEADYRLTGVSLHGHPMRHLRAVLKLNDLATARQLLQEGRDGEPVGMAGLVICRQRPGTAKGFVFLTLEDETGMVNVVVTPKAFERQALLISRTPLLLVRGVLQVEQRVVNIRAREFFPLEGSIEARSHDYR